MTPPSNSLDYKVAWLFPSLWRGSYWHPVLSAFTENCPNSTIFTANWPGFAAGLHGTFNVRIVGKFRYIRSGGKKSERTIQVLPLRIILNLIRFKPDVVFCVAFSLWTVLAFILKPLMRWKIIIIYDGSSRTVDAVDSNWRLSLRRLLTRHTDALVTNSSGGKHYLLTYLLAKEHLVYAHPYEVPDLDLLMAASRPDVVAQQIRVLLRPVFLFVGQVLTGKGLHHLLQALFLLKDWGAKNFTLMVIGDGPQREELENWARQNGLTEHVVWLGWLQYGQLGYFFQNADLLVFPTLADVWGMVVLEAMLFGKPILCSQFAGAADLVQSGYNGFIFDPADHETLANYLKRFIDSPTLLREMGARSKKMIEPFTAQTAANHLTDIVKVALNGNQYRDS